MLLSPAQIIGKHKNKRKKKSRFCDVNKSATMAANAAWKMRKRYFNKQKCAEEDWWRQEWLRREKSRESHFRRNQFLLNCSSLVRSLCVCAFDNHLSACLKRSFSCSSRLVCSVYQTFYFNMPSIVESWMRLSVRSSDFVPVTTYFADVDKSNFKFNVNKMRKSKSVCAENFIRVWKIGCIVDLSHFWMHAGSWSHFYWADNVKLQYKLFFDYSNSDSCLFSCYPSASSSVSMPLHWTVTVNKSLFNICK